jgi:hypothetical protein
MGLEERRVRVGEVGMEEIEGIKVRVIERRY